MAGTNRNVMPAAPVADYRTLQGLVTDHLRAAILDGRLPPGARLQQDGIARQLQVSRMPVREALRILELEGFVELRPHRGAVVVNLQAEEIAEIFEIRALLEGRAAELAAPRLTAETLGRLRQLYDEMAQAERDEERWLALNHDFHTTIYAASGWPRLGALIAAQRNVVLPYLRASFALLDRAATARDEHGRILRAAEARDGARLTRHSAEHLRTTARLLIDYLTARRRTGGRAEGIADAAGG